MRTKIYTTPNRAHQPLSVDPTVATCQILATLAPSAIASETAEAVFEHLRKQNEALTHAPDKEIAASLVRQSVLLEALWNHFAARAASESHADRASALTKAALNCQRALMTAQGTILHLSETRRNSLAVEHEPG